jgi:hypothetical protein
MMVPRFKIDIVDAPETWTSIARPAPQRLRTGSATLMSKRREGFRGKG